MKLYYQYTENILNGTLVTGKLIQLACKWFENDLQRDDIELEKSK